MSSHVYRKQAADLKRVSLDVTSLFVLSSWMYGILPPLFHYLLSEDLSSYFLSSGSSGKVVAICKRQRAYDEVFGWSEPAGVQWVVANID